jgi:hypothetical protein
LPQKKNLSRFCISGANIQNRGSSISNKIKDFDEIGKIVILLRLSFGRTGRRGGLPRYCEAIFRGAAISEFRLPMRVRTQTGGGLSVSPPAAAK